MAAKKTTPLNRRQFLRNSALLSGGVVLLPSLLTGCTEEGSLPEYTGSFGFHEGVASFDPTATSVLLWTRYTPADNEAAEAQIRWEIAETSSFTPLTASGTATATAAADYTVRADAAGLTANKTYYYRFRNEQTKAESVVGQTRTLPTAGQVASIKLAVVSCANYQAGLFNVYGAVAESEADVVVHLGDYIYEYGQGQYGTTSATARLNRGHQPPTEILSLTDYRTRYRQYRGDQQLQRAHQLKPFVCIWDDHELTNDAYLDGAQNHQPEEGSFAQRKQIAQQVWHEYLPARTSAPDKIYRSFDFGGIAHLHLLDTRLAGRDQQLSLSDYFGSGGSFDATRFGAAWLNPNRSLLGAEQRTWLAAALAGSTARWQVLGSQVLMGKMYIPAELLPLVAQLASGGATAALLAQYTALATQLIALKQRLQQNDPTLTAAERARVTTVLPYNLDAWDGYPAEREKVYAAARGKKLISLAGDTHNAWYNDLTDATGRKAGAEFACSSVSSPGFEAFFGGNAAAVQGFAQSNQLLIDDLHYLDASQRGYVLAEFTAAAATAQWRYVASLEQINTQTTTGKTVTES
ncbi:alkaline phosphatase D family protein [Hymenobacter sp. HSC-4F20]|uniref:alkaline phosphatase D family protein n=1 Tax=Hymenobacter sp. HSC-4F20 TaxID=2864135 RepID=UPI001C739397|nr:alkaline phosphatase D family protein [Hymenobacter sp. HSC-4F20]MBX0293051.1 alkaline phosphatase D family protein [Hymenobacter sp. HSC-4F20]